MNKKNTQPQNLKGIIKNSTIKVKRILSNSMRRLIDAIKRLFSFLPKHPKESGKDANETKKDTKRSKDTNNEANSNKENKSNSNNSLNQNQINSSQNENNEYRDQRQNATQQQGDNKQIHDNESSQTDNNQVQKNINKQCGINKTPNSIASSQNNIDKHSSNLDQRKNTSNAQHNNETRPSEVLPDHTEQHQSEFDKIKEGLQQLKSNSKKNFTEEKTKTSDLQKRDNQSQLIHKNTNDDFEDESNFQGSNQENQKNSFGASQPQDFLDAEIIDQTNRDGGQYEVQFAKNQMSQNGQDNDIRDTTLNDQINEISNSESGYEEKQITDNIGSTECKRNDESKTALVMLDSILPNFSSETVPFGDLEQDNEKVDELIVNTIIKKFIRMRFKSQKSQLNTRQMANEKTSGVSKWDTMQVVKHKTTKEYNKMLKDKYDYDYDSGKQEQIPLSIYIDMSPSMNRYIPILSTLSMQLLKNDVRVIIGTNESARMQINSVPSHMTKSEFVNLIKSSKNIDKNTKIYSIDCEISKYLIDKKAEKVIVFSDYDPVRSICALANTKCQVYWFNFDGIRESYLKNYNGVVCQISKVDDILKALISFTAHNYNYLTYKKKETYTATEKEEINQSNFNGEDLKL